MTTQAHHVLVVYTKELVHTKEAGAYKSAPVDFRLIGPATMTMKIAQLEQARAGT